MLIKSWTTLWFFFSNTDALKLAIPNVCLKLWKSRFLELVSFYSDNRKKITSIKYTKTIIPSFYVTFEDRFGREIIGVTQNRWLLWYMFDGRMHFDPMQKKILLWLMHFERTAVLCTWGLLSQPTIKKSNKCILMPLDNRTLSRWISQ